MAALASVIILSCLPIAFGDATRDVYIRNATDQAIVLFQVDRDPRFQSRVAPGETVMGTWRYPLSSGDRRRVRVEADDLAGRTIYCAEFGFNNLEQIRWRIEIIAGHDNCTRSAP